eukprot:TRINITY_DN3323_c0_g1_i1.p1 TRINITY_DN3323_c0_g1~~TRINITY_DN3323_c0_g1_i1.p1  ORF type:complete len:222 (+),score=74.23 TRINITY_DN3323_c0_g1_i1:29-694(+)
MAQEQEDLKQVLDDINARLQEKEAAEDELTEEFLEQIVTEIKAVLEKDASFTDARFALVYVYGHLSKYDEAMAELDIIKENGEDDERWEMMHKELENMMFEMDEEEGENISGMLPEVAGLLEGGGVTEKFVEALTEVFNRFDADKDEILSDAELNEFHKVVNGTPIDEVTVEFLKSNCESTEKGITLKGFISFYVAQTAGEPDETWKDLGNLGYNKDLNRI